VPNRTDSMRPSGHALVLFGVLLTVLALDHVWRHEGDGVATGWHALAGTEPVFAVILVLVVAAVAFDALARISPAERVGVAIPVGLILALIASLVLIVIAAANQSPPVFDGAPADDHPQAPAFAAFGGTVTALLGAIAMLRAGRAPL
jgi:hypothetical protein